MKVLDKAQEEVGYLEKASNKYLDDKTKNAGSSNFTKFSRDLVKKIGSPFAQGVAWCQIFVVWCMIQAYGLQKAKELLGGWTAYTPTAVSFYRAKGRYHKTPQVGDQIFFRNSERVCHTGLVYKVDSQYVYTIEGNTSGASGVIPNGGGVCRKKYIKTNGRIDGYGRPPYEEGQTKKDIHTIALEVIKGCWGNGDERKERLSAAGYDYKEIQKEVNKILKGV